MAATYGKRRLMRLQGGAEGTAGSDTAASAVWRFATNGIESRNVETQPEEAVPYLFGYNRQYTERQLAALQLSGPATFEQFPYICEMGIKTVSGVRDSSGGYVYTYDMPSTDANTIKTYSIEAGDNIQAYQMLYSFCESFELTWTATGGLQVSATLLGRVKSTCSFTSLSTVAVEEAVKCKFFLGATSTYPATSQVNGSLIGWKLSYKTGLHPLFDANGQLYFDAVEQADPEAMLDVTWKSIAAAYTEIVNMEAHTARSLRLEMEGTTIAGGSTWTHKAIAIDLCGLWQSFSVLGQQDGNNIMTGTLKAGYDSTASAEGQIIVVNNLAALV